MTSLHRPKDDPWRLKTPPGTSEYTIHTDDRDGRPVLVCTVGGTVLLYDARCVDDLYDMLQQAGGWVELGGADEQKPAKEGTVEAWGRSQTTPPVAGTASRRACAAGSGSTYLPCSRNSGLCELEHNPRNNRMRAK